MARDQYKIDACIANGENAAGGFGLTTLTAEEMFETGVDFITSGNHILDKRDFKSYLETSERVIRPVNYPPGVPGKGTGTFSVNGCTIGVINVMGRTFMPPQARVIVVDVHAEATSEKVALGRYLDGKVAAVYGTHTHVQTADEHIMPGGTAYISDLGMTGPTEGIIGMESEAVLDRFITGFSDRFSVEKAGTKQFCAAVVTIDVDSGRATEIKRIFQRGIA